MLPAIGLALEAMGAEALSPAILQLAELATEAEDGELTVPLRSSWLESFVYTIATGEMIVRMQDGGSYTYPGTSISTAIGFANAGSPGSYYDANIKLGGKGGSSTPSYTGRTSRIHGV
jgi:hypothetical protein